MNRTKLFLTYNFAPHHPHESSQTAVKVQAALLEVMAERQVTIADESFKLDQPFLVMATQNPVEQVNLA
jgi:MoxR-like ATPase